MYERTQRSPNDAGEASDDAEEMTIYYVGDITWMNIRLHLHHIGRVYIDIFGEVSATKSEVGRAPSVALLQVIQFGF